MEKKKTLMHIKVEIYSKDISKIQDCDRCHINLDIRGVKYMLIIYEYSRSVSTSRKHTAYTSEIFNLIAF